MSYQIKLKRNKKIKISNKKLIKRLDFVIRHFSAFVISENYNFFIYIIIYFNKCRFYKNQSLFIKSRF